MFAIHKNKTDGHNHYLVKEGSVIKTSESLPKGCFVYGSNCCRSLQNMADLFRWNLPKLIPDSYEVMLKSLGAKNPDYTAVIGAKKFKQLIDRLSDAYDNCKSNADLETIKHQTKIECFMRLMQPAPYDPSVLSDKGSMHFEKSLKQHFKSGFVSAPSYIRTKTKTGRLTVVSGPPVLTMHADLRVGLKDAIQVDFRSMEPNLLLAYLGRSTYDDLYSALAQEVFGGKLSRTKVKLSVIASLYNSERRNQHAKKIAEFFNVDEVINNLESLREDNVIKNMYGRPINVKNAEKNHLLSLWLQSSAVDAALTGFCNLLSAHKDAIPYWIIHDALIINNVEIKDKYLDVGNKWKLPIKVESFDEKQS